MGFAHLDALVESATDAIVVGDREGIVVGWNAAAERIFGHAADQVIGRPLTVIVPERFREAHEAGIARVAAGGEQHVIGSTVELSLSTWEEDGERFFGGIVRDVSERVRLAHEAEEARRRLEAILESATDAVVCADVEGRITLWNPAAERMLGHAADEVIGRSLTVIVPERFREAHEAGIARVAAGGDQHVIGATVELAAVCAGGLEIPVELSLSTWTIGDERLFGGIVRDISARKAAEAELQAMNAELEEKTQQLEGLSGKLAKYLSRNVYDSIFEGRTDVKVESYRKLLTVFFSDIQGFTELTDSMEAEALSQLLNEYLSDMADIAARHGGTVDKFIGDGIMIFFGDPDTRGERADALACVEMAIEMRERVRVLQRTWHDRGVARTLHVRMGINTGYCTVGNFGSEDRLDYTIVGGQVNAAARLETAAGPDEILISHSTYGLVKDVIHCDGAGEIKVKGIAYPIRTYRVGGGTGDQDLLLIQEEREGFHLTIDPRALDTEDLQAARETLRRALATLEAQAPTVDFDP